MTATVLRGAVVYDGTGAPGARADVRIDGDRIVDVGPRLRADGDRVVDLDGLCLAPGFVDPHTHYDAQVLWDPALTSSAQHGVTTAVMGNCGFSLAPTAPKHQETVLRTLENVEGMSLESLRAGVTWSFSGFDEYLATLDALPLGINVGAMIGHTPLRLYVLGDAAVERPATSDEIATMRRLVADALRAGALGFATSKSPHHQGDGGRPVPSRYADTDEVFGIAAALSDAGRGVVQATAGPGLFLREFAELSKQLGRAVTWTSLVTGRAELGASLDGMEEMRLPVTEVLELQAAYGGRVFPQMACRPIVMQFTLAAPPSSLTSMAPFESVLAVPPADREAAYRNPQWRSWARDIVLPGWSAQWHRASIQETKTHGDWAGVPLAELASRLGTTPFDVLVDCALDDHLQTRFQVVQANGDEDAIAQLLRDPRTLLGLSDAGAHASQLFDACYSTYLLGHWVRDRQALPLEQAIWRLTGQPADVFGIVDRGVLRPGAYADLVAFDPDTVGHGPLRRLWDLPAGGDRLWAPSTGIQHVWVNGHALDTEELRNPEPVNDPTRPAPGAVVRSTP